MASASYPESIRRLLLSEGGYVNHPSDPGGPTNFGVTIADYRRYVKPGATAADVRAMKVGEAKTIYKSKYWDAIKADQLPAGVDYCLFDYAVNSGTGRAPKVLQRILKIPVTGRVDAATIAAASVADANVLITAICDERLRFMKNLKTWPTFGQGWSRRVRDVKGAALLMASYAAAAPVAQTDLPSQVMPHPDPSASIGKAQVPAPTITTQAVTKGGPAGVMGLLIAFRDWAIAHPADATMLGISAVFVIGFAVILIKLWVRDRQEAPAPAA